MIKFAVYIIAFLFAMTIWRVFKKVMAQRKHLSKWDMKHLMNGKIHKYPDEHERVVGHLSGCKKCQEALEIFNSGKKIETEN